MPPTWGKSTDHHQNLMIPVGWQGISACQTKSNSRHAFARKLPKHANYTCFTNSKWYQNEVNQQKQPKTYHYKGGQDTSACQMSGHCSHAFPIIESDKSSLCVRQQTIIGTNAGFLLILWNFNQLCLLRGLRMRQYNVPLQWCHNEPDGVIIHRRLDCLLDRFFFQI